MKIGDIFESADGIFPQEALDLCVDGVYIQEVEPVDGFIDKVVIDKPAVVDEKTGQVIEEETYKTIKVPALIRRFQIVAPPEPTAEELEAEALAQAKAERADAVSKIIVEVDGMAFDGDEESQTRMGRTIAAAIALGVDIQTYTQVWVLADNTVAQVTISQLAQALKLAGEAQSALWVVPYEAEAE